MPKAALKTITNRVAETPPENPDDGLLLLVCGHWRKARAEHELVLAVHKLALLENPDLDFDEIEAYREMKRMEELLQDDVPSSASRQGREGDAVLSIFAAFYGGPCAQRRGDGAGDGLRPGAQRAVSMAQRVYRSRASFRRPQ
jgi:hypothetical protein